MRVVVTSENHFVRSPNGRIWSPTNEGYQFWQRYLNVFDEVRVIARVRDIDTEPVNHKRVDGPGVSIAAVPNYLGPWQYLTKYHAVRRAVRNGLGPIDAAILRVPAQIANCLYPILKTNCRPYGVEVVGNPWEVFAPGVVTHPLRPFLRRFFTRQLKIQCAGACAAAYVTERALQQQYPVAKGRYKTSYSSIVLPKEALKSISVGISDVELTQDGIFSFPRCYDPAEKTFKLVMVGSLAQMYKGVDVAIDALKICMQNGLNVTLTIVGDGKFRNRLENQAARNGIADRVMFRGQLPRGQAVIDELKKADLFIMPSQTEGLPRAMIEAMAQGLPCIGSSVGGIPELLPPESMFPPNSPQALAAKIREVLADPFRMNNMSARNVQRAKDFLEDALHERRVAFYQSIRDQTEDWIKTQKAVKIMHVATVPVSIAGFLTNQVGYMKQRGFEVHAISSAGDALDRFSQQEQVPVHPVEMSRRITPIRDLLSLSRLLFLFHKFHPSIVHSHTPKGGLLGTMAAWLAKVPVRVYTIHGLPMTTARGLKRKILCWSEWFACHFATEVLTVSHSIRKVAVWEGLCPAAKIKVLCNGSINGVDAADRFNPALYGDARRSIVRQRLMIPNNALVLGFAGRIVRDKGMIDLAEVWLRLREEFPMLHLLLVGPFEPQDPLPREVESLFRNDSRIHLIGRAADMPQYYAAMDVFVLPSYREGFGIANIEAAAMALPVVSTLIPGCIDSVQDGVSGILVPSRDPEALAAAVARYLRDPELRFVHGQAGRQRVLRDFQPKIIWQELYQEYINLLKANGLQIPGNAQSPVLITPRRRLAA
jgi:glycosyltransferase involved in cell wall biosynthesis